jgi:sugar/nucleoside kinase (ribokinase family)
MKPFDISIAGEINLDLILYGLPMDMPAERELLAAGFTATLGSSSAIVAHNAAMLGAKVSFTTITGNDDFGQIALTRLREAGVDVTTLPQHPSLQTGVTIILPHAVDRHMFTYPGVMEAISIDDLHFDRLTQARHFHLSSLYLQKGLHAGLPHLLQRLKDAGLTLSLDTNDDPANLWGPPLAEILPSVDCFLPNESELCRMMHCNTIDAALDALPSAISIVVVKRGSRGATVREGSRRYDVPPLSVTPVDTIGAGDTFDAGFLRAFLLGKNPETCAKAGNIAAALSTQGAGGTEAFRNATLREAFLRDHGFYQLLGA